MPYLTSSKFLYIALATGSVNVAPTC